MRADETAHRIHEAHGHPVGDAVKRRVHIGVHDVLAPAFSEEVALRKRGDVLYEIPGVVVFQDYLDAAVAYVQRVHRSAVALGEEGQAGAYVCRPVECVHLHGNGVLLGTGAQAEEKA